jgi:hypothetical protein
VVRVELECERFTTHAEGGRRFIILPVFTFLMWMTWREEERVVVRGRDTDLPAPVALCGPCRQHFRHPPRWPYLLAAAGVLALAVPATVAVPGLGFLVAVIGWPLVWVARRRAVRGRQLRLKEILRQVPVYRQVLSRYPQAVVKIPRAGSAQPA